MSNRETEVAWRYHDATKHSYISVHTSKHSLDWATQPLPFKIYSSLTPVPLPREHQPSGVPALDAIAQAGVAPDRESVPNLQRVAQLLFFSGGITKHKIYPSGQQVFRAAACTGALYEIELYLVSQALPGLAAGVYHFNPGDFALRQLRTGDYRGLLAQATADEPSVVYAPLTIVCTATYWRNAWKYQARTYRHFGWDNGTVLANMFAAAVAFHLPACIVCGFTDAPVNELLALDTDREVAFALVPVGRAAGPPPDWPAIEPLVLETVPLSPSEVDYPIMREVHGASSLVTAEEVAAWRGPASVPSVSAPSGQTVALSPHTREAMAQDSTEEVILRRGSTRRFKRGTSWSFKQLSTALSCATQGISADFLSQTDEPVRQSGDPPRLLLNQLYVIVHTVDGLQPGAYFLHRNPWELELLKVGNFRDEAGYLGLEQDLPADASAVVFFLADLHAILGRFGNRGYRAAQLEAGILGGKLYLAAYAQRLGASGLTFYDDEVVEFFAPHAQGKSAIFVMTLGKSVRLLHTAPLVSTSRAPGTDLLENG